jgi:hypothetical protein
MVKLSDVGALLLTPPEKFVTAENLDRAYEWHHLNIGFGVTITGPHTVARMTNTLAIKRGDKAREIGTGSGYQSAYLSNLTPNVWSIEIIPALAKRTRAPTIVSSRAAMASIARSAHVTPTAITAGRRTRRLTRSSSPAASITSHRRSCSSSFRTGSWSFPWVRPARSMC